GTITVDKDQTIVSIVGNEIAQTSDILSKLFDALKPVPVRMVSYGGSRHNVSVLLPGEYKVQTLQLLNSGLFGLE
ncbi:MAG: aspartate kinase, partial [Chitinophagaceae bacterium]|nr:aspartate kinase [Chitinophagaceae bacterium]